MTDPITALPEWNLETIYPGLTSSEYRHDSEKLEQLITKTDTTIASFFTETHTVLPSDQTLANFKRAMDHLNEATLIAWKIDSYVAAILDTDAKNTEALSSEGYIQQQLALLKIHSQQLITWAEHVGIDTLESRLVLTRNLAQSLRRRTEYTSRLMSREEESLAAELRRCGSSAWSQLRRSITSAMRVRWDDGESERSLTISDLRALMRSPNRDVRKAIYEAECASWSANAIPLAASLNAIKAEATLLSARRGWSNPLEEALWQFGLNRAVLDSLLSVTWDALPHFHRFLRAKARLIGTPQLAWYDMIAPIGADKLWDFHDAENLVVQAFQGFSPSMGSLANRAFRDQWIDAQPRAGKQSGGLCYWIGNGVSRIRLDFDGGYDGVRTIAHELGHAYHATVLTSARRTALEIETTPLSMWETASKFCEQLVHHEITQQRKKTKRDQLTILDGRLTAMYRSIVEALTVFRFEDRFFIEQGSGGLGVEKINELMTEARVKTSGDALDSDTLFPWTWAALPNLYLVDTSYYNLPYLIAQLIGVSLYAQYEEDQSGFHLVFDQALSTTGSGSLSTFLSHFGTNGSSKEYWSAGLGVIIRDIDRYEELVNLTGTALMPSSKGEQRGA